MEKSYAGMYLKGYKPHINLNSIINSITTTPNKFSQSALLVTQVRFPDASFYQEKIDFDIMSRQTQAIIIRIGQGLHIDDQFERNYAEAKARGLLVGGYWFYDDRYSPGSQADILATAMQGKSFELELFIDWENTYGGSFKGLKNVVAMMQVVEKFVTQIRDIGMYTGYYFFIENSNAISNASQYTYLKNRPLWEGWYTTNPANVIIPAPWNNITHWQFGTPVVAWGQKTKELDMNYFNGSVQQFSDRYGVAIPENGETMPFEITPDKTNGSKIRQDHNTSSVQIGSLLAGKTAFGDERWNPNSSEDWIHITSYENGQGGISQLSGWVASVSAGVKVATITVISEPPPPPPPPPPPTTNLPDHLDAYDSSGNYLGSYDVRK